MGSNFTPSAAEFTGFYNVSAPKKRRDQSLHYLTTVPKVPSLRLEESVEVSRAVYDVLCRYGNNHGFTPEEVRNYYYCSSNVQIEDRTLSTMIEPGDYTLELIDHLQRLLLVEHSLWRIRIVGSSDDTTILIYPSGVRYGSLSDDLDEGDALTTIVERLVADEPLARRIAREHQKTVRRLAGEAIQAGFSGEFVQLVSFDNCEGDFAKIVLWTLCKSDTHELQIDSSVTYMVSDRFYATAEGDLGRHVPDDAPYWVKQWIFPGRELPDRLTFVVSDADYRESLLEVDVAPLRSIRESPR